MRYYTVSTCISCPRLFYWRNDDGREKEEYCPRCASHLHRDRPVLYERRTDIVYTSRRDASEWLWGANDNVIREMIEFGSVLEVYDSYTKRVIGRYTLERWLPSRENECRMATMVVTEDKIDEMIDKNILDRRYKKGDCDVNK